VSGIPPKDRTRIHRNEKVPLELNDRERKLIQWHTFADGTLTDRLRVVPKPGEPPVFHFTLDDLDETRGFVAAESQTTPRIRNTEGVGPALRTAFKLLWTATRTRTIDSNSPFYGPCRTSTLAIPAHQSSAPVYMERWVHRTNTSAWWCWPTGNIAPSSPVLGSICVRVLLLFVQRNFSIDHHLQRSAWFATALVAPPV